MTQPVMPEIKRSYGCEFACGNPYDVILVMVADGTTQFLCMPCFTHVAAAAVEAITNGDAPEVQKAMSAYNVTPGGSVPGPEGKPRGRNAPVTDTNADLFDSFDGRVSFDDLPEVFH